MPKKKVMVAMSGGVDSSVAAALLKKQGYLVTGAFMKNWSGDPTDPNCWTQERRDALRVALKLNIPFLTFDFEKEYRSHVIDYFFREYALGRTPNPDVMCNKEIKFKLFLEKARQYGANFIATGHYARLIKRGGQPHLLVGKDPNKDQSYFLWTLNQEQLAKTLFPIGKYHKNQVRNLAKKFGLPNWDKKDSQGICFVGEIDVKEFLKERLKPKKGPVVTTDGKMIGTHEGAYFYTIGQRHGLRVSGHVPYYVMGKDIPHNLVYVVPGNSPKLFQRELVAENLNWIFEKPVLPKSLQCRIRYQQPLKDCQIFDWENDSNCVKVVFRRPERAVTPGQSVVFYRDDEVLGGGIISEGEKLEVAASQHFLWENSKKSPKLSVL